MQRPNGSPINHLLSCVNTLKAMKIRVVLEHIAQYKQVQKNLLHIEVILTAYHARFSSTYQTKCPKDYKKGIYALFGHMCFIC